MFVGGVEGRDWSALSQLKNLEIVCAAPWKHPDFEPLRGMVKLREVACNVYGRAADLSPFAEMPHLEDLDLWAEHVHDLGPLATCCNLRLLHIGPFQPEAKPWVETFAPLSALTSLRTVAVSGPPKHDGLKPFAKMVWLEELSVSDFATPEEHGWLAAHLPRTKGTAVTAFSLMPNVACRKCGGPSALLHGQSTSRWVCQSCAPGKIQAHVDRFEAGKAQALRQLVKR